MAPMSPTIWFTGMLLTLPNHVSTGRIWKMKLQTSMLPRFNNHGTHDFFYSQIFKNLNTILCSFIECSRLALFFRLEMINVLTIKTPKVVVWKPHIKRFLFYTFYLLSHSASTSMMAIENPWKRRMWNSAHTLIYFRGYRRKQVCTRKVYYTLIKKLCNTIFQLKLLIHKINLILKF